MAASPSVAHSGRPLPRISTVPLGRFSIRAAQSAPREPLPLASRRNARGAVHRTVYSAWLYSRSLVLLDRQRIGRNHSQTYSIRSRGSRAEIKHRRADLVRIAIDHGFLANRHEWRRFRQYRGGGGG